MGTPVVEGWFTTGEAPALLGGRCTTCGTLAFPAPRGFCPDPSCPGVQFEQVPLSRRGTVWSYTDARYQPPPPYVPPQAAGSDTADHVPFALAAVELPEGIVVLGQVAEGYGVDDLRVGSEVELVVEPLYTDETGERLVWRWTPVAELGEEADA